MDNLLPIDRLLISLIVGIIIGFISFSILVISSLMLNLILNKLFRKKIKPIYRINMLLKIFFIGFFLIRIFVRLLFPNLFNGRLSTYNTISYLIEPITLYVFIVLFERLTYKK